MERIRNFSIIAHIDHGKSTLADRILELTDAVSTAKNMRAQVLDSMDLERERGITIKAQAVRVEYRAWTGDYELQPDRHARARRLHLRGLALSRRPARGRCWWSTPPRGSRRRRSPTPTWRSRTASRSSRSSTRSTCPAAEPERVAAEIADLLGDDPGERAAHLGQDRGRGDEVLDAIVERIPAPQGDPAAPPRALIFDSSYDQYRGVVAYVRIVDGMLPQARAGSCAMENGTEAESEEIGFFRPAMTPLDG